QFPAVAVGQADVADDQVDVVIDQGQGGADGGGGLDGVAGLGGGASQHGEGVLVVFHEQDGLLSLHRLRCDGALQRREGEGQGQGRTFAGASARGGGRA